MKKFLLVGAVLATGLCRAQESGFGLGIILGEPTGLSAKSWLSGDRALAFGLAWGFSGNGYLHIHGDYLFHKMDLIQVSKGKLPLYFGPGARLRSWNDHHGDSNIELGIRVPVGLDYLFEGAPVDVFLEVVPGINLIPDTDMDFGGGLGARFWF